MSLTLDLMFPAKLCLSGTFFQKRKSDWQIQITVVLRYSLSFSVITYVVPFLMMGKQDMDDNKFWYFENIAAYCYSVMGRELWGGNKILRMEENSARQPAIARAVEKKRKIVKMNLILVAMFGIIWLPYHVYFIIVFFVPGTKHVFCRVFKKTRTTRSHVAACVPRKSSKG